MKNNPNSLFFLPSPIEQLDLSHWGISNRVYVKRDDLIHDVVSGNKWRKLKDNIAHYFSNCYSGIVTFGGAHSNHILASSYVAEKYRIPLNLIIRGERPKELSPTLKTCVTLGAKLHFLSREQYKKDKSNKLFFLEKFPNNFIIPEGGANRYGISGCEAIVQEINIDFDEIYCDVGTGTTLVGIHRKLKKNQCVRGVVVLKGATYLNKEINRLAQSNPSNGSIQLLHNYHFGGYAKYSEPIIEFMRAFYKQTGIKTDPIYSAKLFYALISELKHQTNKNVVVVVHSGGLQGLEGFEKRYGVKVYP